MTLLQDAGQEQFGASQCETCGMVYTPTDAHDSAAHNKFHHKAVAALKFSVSNIDSLYSETCIMWQLSRKNCSNYVLNGPGNKDHLQIKTTVFWYQGWS